MSDSGPRYSVRLGELAAGFVRIPLAKIGTWVKGGKKFSITNRTMSDIAANFRKRQADTVIDYEHASEDPESAKGQPIPAAGWLKAVEDGPSDDGVLYGQAEFTPRAEQLIKANEYRYMSPVIDWGARDKRNGESQGATLTSMALTNRPFLDTMPALALSDGDWKEINRGDVAKVIMADRIARTVRVVSDDGTENTITMEGLAPEPKVIRLSDVKRRADGRLDIASLETGEGVLVDGEVFHAMKVQAEMDAAVQAGKITPVQRPHFEKIAMSDLAAFREIVRTMPVQVKTGERGIAGGTEDGDLPKVEARLLALTDEKLKANSGMQYHEALKLVASEHPDLNRQYTVLSRERMTGRE
jgi:phage I-like protein